MINHALKKDTMINQHVLDLNIFLTTISYNDEVASINNILQYLGLTLIETKTTNH